ncbi:RadC family protein [Teredinibacter sp. KSP-S5-2]|uniref:RadC family protein n=1 Tax=Teredinibacter sp. KSP-S5-2 TaxID=3034506 RepID=UPI002934CB59|nr:DNA repair protein RadC [Teredinibacter sp. KSP-S5-2]WNO09312.1 DNA repair protein RadC [Teredinibacter sp. KSP-S5-2]
MPITDWPADERPREKLLLRGAQALSDAELLAIFLRTGCAGKSAVDLARELLKQFGTLRSLLEAPKNEFCRANGLGTAKYSQLQAVLEMSRRHIHEKITLSKTLSSSRVVKDFFISKLRHHHREVFAAAFLDCQNQFIAYEELFFGTIDSASVHPREVVKTALHHNAASVIFAHNHPSGNAEPSQQDKVITQTLRRALQLVDIHTLDHIVVGHGEPVSFAERGLI